MKRDHLGEVKIEETGEKVGRLSCCGLGNCERSTPGGEVLDVIRTDREGRLVYNLQRAAWYSDPGGHRGSTKRFSNIHCQVLVFQPQ